MKMMERAVTLPIDILERLVVMAQWADNAASIWVGEDHEAIKIAEREIAQVRAYLPRAEL